jgi:hypothetical protein
MANLVIAKKDMTGRVMIGEGWLVCRSFAVRVGDDPRFQSVETARAAFKGFEAEELDERTAHEVTSLWTGSVRGGVFLRTRVLMEDQESGELLRAYRHADSGQYQMVPERLLQILGKPPFVALGTNQDVIVAEGKGLISTNTEALPSWAKELA